MKIHYFLGKTIYLLIETFLKKKKKKSGERAIKIFESAPFLVSR